mgnify:FL=1
MYFASPEKEGVKRNIIIFIFISFFLLLIDTYDRKYFRFVKSAINDTAIYSALILKYPFKKIASISQGVSEMFDDDIDVEEVNKLQNELKSLKNQNDSLNFQLKKLQTIVNEEQYDHNFINSKVILYKKNLLSNSILLSKGKLHGVEPGDPVVRENRLVGKIIDVNYGTSKAILLTNIRSRIPVSVGENGYKAILVGNPNVDGGISLEFLPRQAKLKNGDKIFTSSIDKIIPPGILVGQLKIVTKKLQDPNMNFGRGKGARPINKNKDIIKLSIDLAFEINQLDYVTIMSLKK